jgi:hypothetical protein
MCRFSQQRATIFKISGLTKRMRMMKTLTICLARELNPKSDSSNPSIIDNPRMSKVLRGTDKINLSTQFLIAIRKMKMMRMLSTGRIFLPKMMYLIHSQKERRKNLM